MTNWDFDRVQSTFGDLTGVKYVLMATTALGDPAARVWLSDSAASGTANDESNSRWTQQRGKINAVGSRATSYAEGTNQTLVISSSDPNSYRSIASSGGALDVIAIAEFDDLLEYCLGSDSVRQRPPW